MPWRQVIIEEDFEARWMSKGVWFSAFSEHPSSIRDTDQHRAIKFWSSRIDKYVKSGNNGDNQGKGDKVQQSPNQIKPHSTVVSHDAARSLALAKEPKVSSISEVAECNTSQMAAKTVPTTGMAIIATGASHSVIGSDHVPQSCENCLLASDKQYRFSFW